MELDDLLFRYFGTRDLVDVNASSMEAGIDRMRVDFGLERDRGRRFALWCLLHMMGAAPELGVAFEDAADQEAARNFMDLLAGADES
ncbi:MAG: hypothetical protein KDK08_07805 [Rhizobiaceae bacterium]|nr:hypothetical protein [Rhizobiaceae bacterium]